MQRWVVIPLAVFVFIAGLFAFALIGDDPSILPSKLIGEPVPETSFPALEGLRSKGSAVQGFSASELKTGRPTLVNFWASWCAPCVAEHPMLMRLKERHGVEIFSVNYKDEPANARRFLGRFGNPFHAVGVDSDGRGAIEWGVAKMPETFVIDGQGMIVAKHSGPLDAGVLEKKVLPALNAASPAP